jgi:hypothetical protein
MFVNDFGVHIVTKHRVAEPEPAGAETFGWSRSRNIEVSAPAPGQLKYLKKI